MKGAIWKTERYMEVVGMILEVVPFVTQYTSCRPVSVYKSIF